MLNERRHYTLAEARRTLPLVRRIVADIVAVAVELKRREAGFKRHQTSADDEFERLQARLRKYSQELDALGIELKDPLLGLVDYYWRRGEETVYLCWKHGEEEIGYWHDLESGFGGRQPLDPVDHSLDASR